MHINNKRYVQCHETVSTKIGLDAIFQTGIRSTVTADSFILTPIGSD